MRKLAVLLAFVAVSPALAQDDGGAALFYKGFWLEQAEGKLDEAAALYGKLLSEKPDAPEAPRALLGLVRIKVAKGEDALELVAELERRYPAAKDEIAAARKIAVRVEFDFEVRRGDSPVLAKLKSLYPEGVGWTGADRLFLIDLGSAAHPMLAQLLRSRSDARVQGAADVLVAQRTAEAYAVLAAALLDETALFRSTIVEALQGRSDAPRTVTDALARLYEGTTPRLREQIVRTLASLAFGEGRDRAFEVLTRALADRDEGVRTTALSGVANAEATDAYVDAALKVVEAGAGPEPSWVAWFLLRFADRAAFRERIERIVGARNLQELPDPLPDEGAVMLARILVRNHGQGRRPRSTLVKRAAAGSPRAASLLLRAAIETGDDVFANIDLRGDHTRTYLGDEADRIRAAAIAAAEGIGERRPNADPEVLEVVGVAKQDFPSIVEGLRRRGERRFPLVLLRQERLWDLGPAKAGALAEFCRSDGDVLELLRAGINFKEQDDAGVEFFRQVVPRTGIGAAGELAKLLAKPALATLVVDRLLAGEGAEWEWGVDLRWNGAYFTVGDRQDVLLSHDDAARKCPGPYLWRAIRQRGLPAESRPKLVLHVGDKRPEIAVSAAGAAAEDKSEAGTEALRRALGSEVPAARAIALVELVERVADGPTLVREFAGRADLTAYERDAVAAAIQQGPAYAALAAELLRLGTWPELWPVYQEIAPKECVDLAYKAAHAEKTNEHRLGAIRILTATEDPRRFDVFRQVLKGTDRPAIIEVLCAVRDQYLVELGQEALAQLRNPDPGIRQVATEAIDKLKFYAEAKKAFEK